MKANRTKYGMVVTLLLLLMAAGCGKSYEEIKRENAEQQRKLMREDSAALKIAVMPTLDCLPLYVAKDRQLFDTLVDIRLKPFTAQMDCDTALTRGRVEAMVTDLVRAERIMKEGMPLDYVAATNAYWLLIGNHHSRITNLKHLDDKMLAMTRYSVTDMLSDLAVDTVKLKPERVFRIQINDVNVRLKMLENNVMDALLLPEPYATQARIAKNKVLLDTRKLDMNMGVIAFRKDIMDDKTRKPQLDAFLKGYNAACDSISKNGVKHYRDVIQKYCKVSAQTLDSLPDSLNYPRAAAPREKDLEQARQWLAKRLGK